jgi:mannose-6-phosphate isomerase
MKKLEKQSLYPLLFTPIYKELVWGGEMLKTHLNRELPKTKVPIGESWEIVDRDDAISIVENGYLKGKTIRELLEVYGVDIVGKGFNGGKFPLLIKMIDAGQRLSLQVHPDETISKKLPGAEPKTEMWYVIAAKSDANIIAGLNYRCTKRAFVDTYQTTAVESNLQISKSVPGDAYFINAGTVHAIGEGNLILEIQQNSNTTYRISDWGRVGVDGKPRELHVKEAMECIHFSHRNSPKISGVIGTVAHNRKFPIVKNYKFFKVDDLRLTNIWTDNTKAESFHLLTAINGPIKIVKDEMATTVGIGRNCLIPAAFGSYKIEVNPNMETTVIKTVI